MGRYEGNMPGGWQRNPEHKTYKTDPKQYNLRIKTNQTVRKLPMGEWRALQEEIRRRRHGGEVEQTIHDNVVQRVTARLAALA